MEETLIEIPIGPIDEPLEEQRTRQRELMSLDDNAKVRVAIFLLFHLLTAPVAFIVRYIDKDFLKVYTRLRGQWLAYRLAGYFVVLCLLPHFYFRALPYDCEVRTVLVNGTNATLQGHGCDAVEYLRSWKSLWFGPTCLVSCIFVCYWNVSSDSSPVTDRFLLRAQAYLPNVPFSGLGPRFRAGTGNLCAEKQLQMPTAETDATRCRVLCLFFRSLRLCFRRCCRRRRSGEDKDYHWEDDILGANDVVMVISVMNMSCFLLILVCPVCTAWYHNVQKHRLFFDICSATVKDTGVAFTAATVVLRILFAVADKVFGAPKELVNAVNGVLKSAELQRITNDQFNTGRTKARNILSSIGRMATPAPCCPCLASPRNVMQEVNALADMADFVDPIDMDPPAPPMRGILWKLYSNGFGMCLSMPRDEFELFASLSPEGYVLARLDPEYEMLMQCGFGRQFPTSAVYIHNECLMGEQRGIWRVSCRLN